MIAAAACPDSEDSDPSTPKYVQPDSAPTTTTEPTKHATQYTQNSEHKPRTPTQQEELIYCKPETIARAVTKRQASSDTEADEVSAEPAPVGVVVSSTVISLTVGASTMVAAVRL